MRLGRIIIIVINVRLLNIAADVDVDVAAAYKCCCCCFCTLRKSLLPFLLFPSKSICATHAYAEYELFDRANACISFGWMVEIMTMMTVILQIDQII